MRNAEARAMGLSYGKYMALVRDGLIRTEIAPEPAKDTKKETKPKHEPEYELGTVACAICGKEFPMRTRRSRTCGPACRAKLNLQRCRERYRRMNGGCDQKKECSVCGKVFIPKRMGTLYCTDKCREKASAMRRRKFLPGTKTIICAWCGADFSPEHGSQKYCGKDCYNAARRGKERERSAKLRAKAREEKENC
jgi:predicted nucleic acid-binding Zn ribbon protein